MNKFLLSSVIVLSTLFSPLAAFAGIDEIKSALAGINNCRNFLKVESQYIFLGYGFYSNSSGGFHLQKPTLMTVIPVSRPEHKFQIEISDSAIDLITHGDLLYILTYTGIEEWNTQTWTRLGVYPTQNYSTELAFEEHATQMAEYKNQLVISHGRLGISIFDRDLKKIIFQQKLVQNRLPLESKATGIAVIGDKAYVALDSFTLQEDPHAPKKPFQGIVVFDLQSRNVISELDGMEPGSDNLFAYNNRLIVSFYGIPLLKFGVERLTGTRMPGPQSRISIFPEQGRLLGKPTLDSEYIYTCFQRMPQKPGESIERVPRVWPRKNLRLAD
jgi:hypothetical protein